MENPLYAKIFKWISWALLIISVVLAAWAFTRYNGGHGGAPEENAVQTMLYWAYAMVILALIAVFCIGIYVTAKTDPKSLVRIGIALAAAAALCLVAYVLASGAPALNLTSSKLPTAGELKLTDTVLNLTYILGAASVAAIVAGEVISGIRKNKA
ncbi:MAG: hypothetical protein IJ893_06350 [Bacteroidales bacterium]|jgi:hypothetical protein|nr:hypothetical protein [Bacteroidales bacterium]MBR3097086.1 hypothetical protein [Bacteroidales bacterium]MBR4688619.1 hypothetical protein [Bacteroidales bacterium]